MSVRADDLEATIHAQETGDETVYVLRRPSGEMIVSHWPGPLLELEPNAVRVATVWDREGCPRRGYVPHG